MFIFLYLVKLLSQFSSFRSIIRKIGYETKKVNDIELSMLLSPEKKVLNGPFKGMKYPRLISFGSVLPSKLLGSYEDELHPLLYRISKKNYYSILDIGCAEGYYAVGFSKLFPKSKIVAFDTDQNAIDFCKEFAQKNNVLSQISFGQFCDEHTLKDYDFTKKSLILSDCEGYEMNLFTKDNIGNLSKCDVLIEVHDEFDSRIADYLLDVFSSSHKLEIISSKLKSVKDYPDMVKLGFHKVNDTQLIERNTQMNWFFFESKTVD